MGFKEESASRGLIQKQDKVFDYLSFYRAGLTKVLMLVSFKETKNVRFQKIVLDPFWFWFSFGSLFPRLVSAFRLFSLVTFVDPTGKTFLFKHIYILLIMTILSNLSLQYCNIKAVCGPLQSNWTADGKVQHWNNVRQRLDMLSDIQFNFFLLFIYGWVFIIFRYAVVGVMEEFETSLEVLQVQYVR